MDTRTRRSSPLATWMVGGLLLLAGCDQAETEGDTYRTIECGTQRFHEEDGTVLEYEEVYFLDHIESRLRTEPLLRERVDLDGVETCDDARHFTEVANAYDEEFPEDESTAEAIPAAPVLPLEALPVDGPDLDELPEGVTPIYKGDVYNGILGVVKLGSGCSGAFIRNDVILTAAHCFGSGGTRNVTIREGENNVRTVSANVIIHPSYTGTGDRFDDTALVFVNGNLPWVRNPWLLYRGPTTKGTRLHIYGYGNTTLNGYGFNSPNSLRYGDGGARVKVDYHKGTGYFRATAGTARVCKGDSGGPAVGNYSIFSKGTIWGTVWGGETSGNETCPRKGHKMWWTKVSTKTNWIAQRLGTCTFYGDYGKSGSTARCY